MQMPDFAYTERTEDADKLFFGGLALLISPVFTSWLLQPDVVLYLMCLGLCSAVVALLSWES